MASFERERGGRRKVLFLAAIYIKKTGMRSCWRPPPPPGIRPASVIRLNRRPLLARRVSGLASAPTKITNDTINNENGLHRLPQTVLSASPYTPKTRDLYYTGHSHRPSDASSRLLAAAHSLTGLDSTNEQQQPSERPPSAHDLVFAYLDRCQSLDHVPSASSLGALAYVAALDRDWPLVVEVLAEVGSPNQLRAALPQQQWSSVLEWMANDAPDLVGRVLDLFLVFTGKDEWVANVLAPAPTAMAVCMAVQKDRVDLVDRLGSLALHNDSTALPVALAYALSRGGARHHELLTTLAARFPAVKTLMDSQSHIHRADAAAALSHLADHPNLLEFALLHAFKYAPLRSRARALYRAAIDLPSAVPLTLTSFSGYLTSASQHPDATCDTVWMHIHRRRRVRISGPVALDLALWTATHAPQRLAGLMVHFSSDRVVFPMGPAERWTALFRALRKHASSAAPPPVAASTVRLMYTLSVVATADRVRVGDRTDEVVNHWRHVESMFLDFFAAAGAWASVRWILSPHNDTVRDLTRPLTDPAIRALCNYGTPATTYSLLRREWEDARRRQRHQRHGGSGLRPLLLALLQLSATVHPTHTQIWARHLARLETLETTDTPVPSSSASRGNNDPVLYRLRALGRTGDAHGVRTLAHAMGADDPQALAALARQLPAVASALAVASARTLVFDVAERVVGAMDLPSPPTEVEIGEGVGKSSQQERRRRAGLRVAAYTSLRAAELRVGANSLSPLASTEPPGTTTMIDSVSALNLDLQRLRAQLDVAGIRSLLATSVSNPGDGGITSDAVTLTLVLTASLRAAGAAMHRHQHPHHPSPSTSSSTLALRNKWTLEPDPAALSALTSWTLSFLMKWAPSVGHRYHAHLAIELLVLTGGPDVWSRIADLVDTMAAGGFGGRHRGTGARASRPTLVTFAKVSAGAVARLAEIGVETGMESEDHGDDDGPPRAAVAAPPPTLAWLSAHLDRLSMEKGALPTRTARSEVAAMADGIRRMAAVEARTVAATARATSLLRMRTTTIDAV
ncbi:hypothetical protein BC828DRAFT_383647 [Blastocladiella britannica]|nr:hypothetical protein BC828DRAFT_383647 [Blastocladiella britannica]